MFFLETRNNVLHCHIKMSCEFLAKLWYFWNGSTFDVDFILISITSSFKKFIKLLTGCETMEMFSELKDDVLNN